MIFPQRLRRYCGREASTRYPIEPESRKATALGLGDPAGWLRVIILAALTAVPGAFLRAQERVDPPPDALDGFSDGNGRTPRYGIDARDHFGARNGELSDRRIAARVRRAIFSDPRLYAFGRGVLISAFNGVVILEGRVATRSQRLRLEQEAGRIVGSRRVDDRIVVR